MGYLEVQQSNADGVTVLIILGELTSRTVPVFRQKFRGIMKSGSSVIVNLNSAEYVDSTGLAMLFGTYNIFNRHGLKMVLICNEQSNPRTRAAIKLTGLSRVFRLADTTEQALGIIRQS